ncbi:MAG: Asp-tRNA(Asn)/Glu-tRNA(Gln) amidotransferase subunit GatC [Planctomycetes bacterium]|jgi:aspartyl-tRNA(Asn)/glutamyl-tRNA(Gln) amidotransferase subunit C|nr:Asp-tRNA(Asn)/Glu-tRNA(Gln) amidotransferase subunit GatC [Planctomycetota bacterium]MCL4731290.1 Asp-tRNA(Asn)/Glu-tRNA(Gln) amidotransferase subunit GatC [Planctomycetota bacterium]
MDLKTVQHVARLARLQLTDAEAARMAADMARITEHIHALGKVDVRGVEPTVHPVAARNQWREDAVTESFTREQATQNAPESEQNFFKVPPVIE